jgi:DNA-binding transcriptional MerR regulator
VTTTETYKLEELAEQAGVSARTVRYYVQRGLLPAPAFRGRDTAYGREHLLRLRIIRRLQDRFLPLDAIEAALAHRSLAELERMAAGHDLPKAGVELPVRSEPPQTPPRRSPVEAVRRFERHELRPGLELQLADDAGPEARALFEALVRLARLPSAG